MKNALFYLIFSVSILFEYYQIATNDGKETFENIYQIIPVYVFLTLYSIFTLQGSFVFLKKYSEKISFKKGSLYRNSAIKFSENKVRARIDQHSFIDKVIVIFLDMVLCCSLLLFIYSFTLCLVKESTEKSIYFLIIDSQIKFTASIGSVLYILGNLYKVGDMIIGLLLYSIEKEFFPAPVKKYRIRLSTNTNLYVYYSTSFLRQKTFENDNEIDGLISNISEKK